MNFTRVAEVLRTAVTEGAFPGAVLLVGKGKEVLYHEAFGSRALLPHQAPLDKEVIFDVSSLTKPLATTTAFLLLARERKLRLEDRVTRVFHNFGVYGKTRITFRNLLTHSSGLPAHRPFFKEILHEEAKKGRVNFICSRGAKEFVYDKIHHEKLEYPTGERALYSDLGFILLGQAIENVTGVTLDRFCQERIFRPLGLRSMSFIDLSLMRTHRLVPVTDVIAPTEDCPWRKRVLCGEVHDDNAYAMGGVAGHAGLFANARDLHSLVSTLIASHDGDGTFLPRELVEEAFRIDDATPESTRTIGWDTPDAVDSAAGRRFSKRTVGHLGFTGTSVWIDLERKIHVILLTNRVHPTRDNDAIKTVRPLVHDEVVAALGD